MTKTPNFVQGVQGLCRHLCRVFHSCAGCAGSIALSRAYARGTKPTPQKRTHARIYTLHTLHTLHIVDSYTFFAHATLHKCLHTLHRRARARVQPLIHLLKSKKMEETPKPAATRTIRCTPDNAFEMQQFVKNWPELHALVQHLQAQNLFPGLRGLSITLTGPESFVCKGLAALDPKNAPKRD